MMRKLPFLILVGMVVLSGCASTYEVTLNIEPVETGTVLGSGTYKSGESVAVEAELFLGTSFCIGLREIV